MTINKYLSLLILIFIVVLSSCATIDKFLSPSLSGTPATSSLVVVKCEATVHGAFDIVTNQTVNGGVLLSTDGSKRIEGDAVSGLIIFSDVPPGEYNLARVRTTWRAGNSAYQNTYNVSPDQAVELIVNTKLGESKFLGIVTLVDVRGTSERGVNFSLLPSKKAEAETWEKFIQIYSDHPWANEVRKLMSN